MREKIAVIINIGEELSLNSDDMYGILLRSRELDKID